MARAHGLVRRGDEFEDVVVEDCVVAGVLAVAGGVDFQADWGAMTKAWITVVAVLIGCLLSMAIRYEHFAKTAPVFVTPTLGTVEINRPQVVACAEHSGDERCTVYPENTCVWADAAGWVGDRAGWCLVWPDGEPVMGRRGTLK